MMFEMYKYLDIALSKKPNSTSIDDSDISIFGSISIYIQISIVSWIIYHAFACEVLLHSLESIDLFKVIPYRNNISAI